MAAPFVTFYRCEQCRTPFPGNIVIVYGRHKFCSAGCMFTWKSSAAPSMASSRMAHYRLRVPAVPQSCRLPGCQRHCRIEGSRIHDYCCRSHAQLHQSPRICGFPGCTKPCYVEGTTIHDYCCRLHAIVCQRVPQLTTGERLLNLAGTRQFERIKRSLSTTWRHEKGPLPMILFILEIVNPTLEARFKAYISSLPPRSRNTEEYYHGTSFKCSMPRDYLCSDPACGVCGISKKGFDPARISSQAWQRFGKGFYFAVNSSKAYDYPLSLYRCPPAKQPRHRCLLVCEVAPGCKHYVYQDDPLLKGPPPGCHSVYGKANSSPNGLNYEEIVLYQTEAIRPHYIIVLQNTFV